MKHLKLRTKVYGSFLSIFVMAIIIGGYAVYSNNRLGTMRDQMYEISDLSRYAEALLEAHHVWISNLATAFLFDEPFGGSLNPDT